MPITVIMTKTHNITVATNCFNKSKDQCITCFKHTYQGLFDKFKVEQSIQLSFLVFFQQIITAHPNLSPPEIQRILNIKFCELIGVNDPFKNEKEESNRKALELYKKWLPKLNNSTNDYDISLKLSIAGNIMDYGAHNTFDIEATIQKVLASKFAINKSKELKNAIKNAQTILYLGDNAGEIVFDKLFIETCLKNKKVIFAVRSKPILNDVTKEDAFYIGMDKVAEIIENGFDAPSTILKRCSYDFRKVFKEADLIISKGQGNLEGLINENDSRIFFLLMIKCDVIASLINVKMGDFVVYNRVA